MTTDEVKIRLTAIRNNLPPQYSQSASRKLVSAYENYKHMIQELGHSYSSISPAVRSALPGIEVSLKQAMKGTPKKDSEESFNQVKQQLTEGINSILLADQKKLEKEQ